MTTGEEWWNDPDWCWSCCKIERRNHSVWTGQGYRTCFECNHFYRTRWHLSKEYLSRYWEIWSYDSFGERDPLLKLLYYSLKHALRPSKIFFCQVCSHSF